MEEKDIKLDSYKRLKSIFADGDPLSDKGYDNLNKILDIENKKQKSSFLVKFYDLFKKLDSFIFKKGNKMYNNVPYKRKR